MKNILCAFLVISLFCSCKKDVNLDTERVSNRVSQFQSFQYDIHGPVASKYTWRHS